MSLENLLDLGVTTVSSTTIGKTIALNNWATLSRGVVPVELWVYAQTATVGDTGRVVLLDDSAAELISVDIDNGPGWYSATGELPAATEKYDMHFGDNTAGTLAIKDFSLFPLIT